MLHTGQPSTEQGKRLSEEYLRQLNDKVLEGLKTSKKVGAPPAPVLLRDKGRQKSS
jgi:hypothetical protein